MHLHSAKTSRDLLAAGGELRPIAHGAWGLTYLALVTPSFASNLHISVGVAHGSVVVVKRAFLTSEALERGKQALRDAGDTKSETLQMTPRDMFLREGAMQTLAAGTEGMRGLVPAVHAVVTTADDEGLLVMDFVAAVALCTVFLKAGSTTSLAAGSHRAVLWGLLPRIADDGVMAIKAIHGAGLVHGDLTTSNLMVAGAVTSRGPLLRFIDYGFSCVSRAGDGATSLCKFAQVGGTPGYMHPGLQMVQARAEGKLSDDQEDAARPVLGLHDWWGLASVLRDLAIVACMGHHDRPDTPITMPNGAVLQYSFTSGGGGVTSWADLRAQQVACMAGLALATGEPAFAAIARVLKKASVGDAEANAMTRASAAEVQAAVKTLATAAAVMRGIEDACPLKKIKETDTAGAANIPI